MAEERFIDDDKDRKYKIRKNADGEEELYIDEEQDAEGEEVVYPVFEVPETDEDDEDAALLTPEQFAERQRLKRQEEEEKKKKAESFLSEARAKIDGGDFEGARYAVSRAEELIKDGETYSLKMRALSMNFTDFTLLDECVRTSEAVKVYCTDTQKAELDALSKGFKDKIEELSVTAENLRKEVEEKQQERGRTFSEAEKKKRFSLILSGAGLLLSVILLAVFASQIYATQNGSFLIAAIVFGVITFAALVVTLICTRAYLTAHRRRVYNEDYSSTQSGREYLEYKKQLDNLNTIISSFKQI